MSVPRLPSSTPAAERPIFNTCYMRLLIYYSYVYLSYISSDNKGNLYGCCALNPRLYSEGECTQNVFRTHIFGLGCHTSTPDELL